MKIIPQNKQEDFSLPLPIYTSIHIADAVCKQSEEYKIYIGIEKKYAEQLKKLVIEGVLVRAPMRNGMRKIAHRLCSFTRKQISWLH